LYTTFEGGFVYDLYDLRGALYTTFEGGFVDFAYFAAYPTWRRDS
jgi:hypothetical protein